jgi:hypothetical protein
MRGHGFVLAALILGSCSAGPIEYAPSPKAQRELADALAGRTPGAPLRCIPSFKADRMEVIDDYTIIYRDGRTIYLQRPPGGCMGIASGGRTLVRRTFGTTDLCEGDINHTVDLSSGIGGGSCVFGPFVPYTKPKG